MDQPVVRLMIQGKLADGRLPHDYISRIGGGPGDGETCDGCGEIVTKARMMMEGSTRRDAGSSFTSPASTSGT